MVKNRDIIGCFGVILAVSGWLLSAKFEKIPKNGENWGLCGARQGRVEAGEGSETVRVVGVWRGVGRRDKRSAGVTRRT